MTAPYFFGYGSLVNRQTHVYTSAHPASITGWRRVWRHIAALDHALLTATPVPDARIEGLVAEVPGADWAALDEREMFYARVMTRDVAHPVAGTPDVQIYHAAEETNAPSGAKTPILLSYLDVIVQGYLAEFGEAGVARFFETTDGWDAPVLADRQAPRYPRHQALSDAERGLTDAWLDRLQVSRLGLEDF
jgi:hypothetical protein